MKSVKQTDIKSRTHYFLDNVINIKNLDSHKMKIDEKSYKKILIYDFEYVTVKDLIYATPNSVTPLYLFINKMNYHIEESNKNRVLTLVLTDET